MGFIVVHFCWKKFDIFVNDEEVSKFLFSLISNWFLSIFVSFQLNYLPLCSIHFKIKCLSLTDTLKMNQVCGVSFFHNRCKSLQKTFNNREKNQFYIWFGAVFVTQNFPPFYYVTFGTVSLLEAKKNYESYFIEFSLWGWIAGKERLGSEDYWKLFYRFVAVDLKICMCVWNWGPGEKEPPPLYVHHTITNVK